MLTTYKVLPKKTQATVTELYSWTPNTNRICPICCRYAQDARESTASAAGVFSAATSYVDVNAP